LTPAEVLERLLELADEAGLAVRLARGGGLGDIEPALASGVCRVRGELRVVLSASEPAEARIAVLAGALRAHRAEWLESRYLAPALREWLAEAPRGDRETVVDPRSGRL
jgi:hypothetical protein